MKNILGNIYTNKYFNVFIILFAYIQSIQTRLLVRQKVDIYIFTPEDAIFTFISVWILFFIVSRLVRHYSLNEGKSIFYTFIKIFILSLLLYVTITNILSLLVSLAFGTFSRNFNEKTLFFDNLSNVLDVVIYSCFFFAYYFYQKNKSDNERLASYNQALSNSKISQLKAQLNPHFLFNNLNILDQLIEEDRIKASTFLNDFAELYRYVLQTSDKKLVPLNDELSFAKSYFRIMQQKYGSGYRLDIDEKDKVVGFIPPLTLQLLIENAIEHNLGSEDNPIYITIEIGERITVTNNTIKKTSPKLSGGKALQNLKEQYKLLSNNSVEILHNLTQFTVSLPTITKQNV